VLGANDGIVSTASLVLGVAAADVARSTILTAGLAGLFAGALSMALGEFVSVSSQRDMEEADIAKERHELATMPDRELAELTHIYMNKGLDHDLAHTVAVELSKGDQLKVHMEEELGLTELTRAKPSQAAAASALSFAVGAALPLAAVAIAPASTRLVVTFVFALLALGVLGSIGARLGGAPIRRAVTRVIVGGAIAMGVTLAVGEVLGEAVT
jgi:vacuolar iron transporter family protein